MLNNMELQKQAGAKNIGAQIHVRQKETVNI